ncbi:MAG: RiPP maturation radical SAM C-methyltransferase, partial [Acidimicrobiales bacterium]
MSMPFGPIERPSLGLGLLQAAAQRAGFECHTRYLGFDLAERIGLSSYQWVSHSLPYDAFVGEWLFTAALHGAHPDRDLRFESEVLRDGWHLDEQSIASLQWLRQECTTFIDECADQVNWADYDVVGFTSTFHQNIAALAMAAEVKRRVPSITTVAGGANWEGEMGAALLDHYPQVDYACSGEADRSFPQLLTALANDDDPASVPGVLVAGMASGNAAGDPINDLDELPIPDFAPYYGQLADSAFADEISPALLLETARGCWWGAISHCTFCGLNGESMSFRSKSPERVLAEIEELTTRWGADVVSVVDNILDMRYFRSVLGQLAERPNKPDIFWEVKANLSRSQVQLLSDAGVVTVQPGIESLSNDVLSLMAKGTTAVQNVAMLKWCMEYGVTPEWNLLYGFPDENPDDYEQMRVQFAALHHLNPPSGSGSIRVDRFSPYHENPGSFGMEDLTPAKPFGFLYPDTGDDLYRIAYYFDFRYGDGRRPSDYASGALGAIETWRRRSNDATFWMFSEGDARILCDSRGQKTRTARLEGWKAAVYDACDRGRTRKEIDQLDELHGVTDDEVDTFLDRCLKTGAMMTDGERYLALAVAKPA